MSRRIPLGAPIVTAAEMRVAERTVIDGGVAVDELMERAGLAVAREVRRFAVGRPVLVAAGPGNNGGDAYVAARHLADWGLDVLVATLGSPREGAAARMAGRWNGPSVPMEQAERRPIFVDGLFGTGGMRPLTDALHRRVDALCRDADLSVAIDLPSGVDPNGAATHQALSTDITVALGALKRGHVVGPDAARCGHLLIADIGVPVGGRVRTIRPEPIAQPGAAAQKFSRGMVLVVGGAMPGAALLAATAAMHGGAGYVVLAAAGRMGEVPHALVRRTLADPAALGHLLADDRIGAVVIGPGLGRDDAARALLDRALASPCDLVIDADALSLLGRDVGARIAADRRHVVLTPHSGEFDRLFGENGGDKIERTIAAARATGATIVHKGADTGIASPAGEVIVSAGATPWLSTAGTGDVLAGLVGARLARHRREPLMAAEEAVWWHAAAARLTPPPFAADDVVRRLPAAMPAAASL